MTRKVAKFLFFGIIGALLTYVAIRALALFIFSAPGTGGAPVLHEYIIVGIYWGLAVVALMLFRCLSRSMRRCSNDALPLDDRHAASGGQWSYWPAAIILSCIASSAIVVAGKETLNNQNATWVKITTNAGPRKYWKAQYGTSPDDFADFEWQPFDESSITFVRSGASVDSPVRVHSVVADGVPVSMGDIRVTGGRNDGETVTLNDDAGNINWPTPARHIVVEISGPPDEPVKLYWLDRVREFPVSTRVTAVEFDLGAQFQGWALLPPRQIDFLGITNITESESEHLVEITVFAPSPQRITAASGNLSRISPDKLEVRGFRPINEWNAPRLALTGLLLFLVSFGMIFVIHESSLLSVRSASIRRWLRQAELEIQRPPLNWVNFWKVGFPVWMACCAAHTVFFLTVRTGIGGDAISYFGMAIDLMKEPILHHIAAYRTPGYPLFIAAITGLTGNTLFSVVVAQHMAIAVLSLITIWCLWDRLPILWLMVAGLLTGLSPVISSTANSIWSESLYVVLSYSAVMFALCYGRGGHYLLLSGFCAGLATMIRPNGLIVVAAISLYLILLFLCHSTAVSKVRTLVFSLALVILGYVVSAGPWHMHLALKRNIYTFTDLKVFNAWAGYIWQHKELSSLPINTPNKWIYACRSCFSNNPDTLLSKYSLIPSYNRALYYKNSERQAFAANPESWRLAMEAIIYYSTLIRIGPGLVCCHGDIPWTIDRLNESQPIPGFQGEPSNKEELLILSAFRSQPKNTAIGSICLGMSAFFYRHWAVTAGLAALGFVLCAFTRPWTVLPAAYAFGTILAYSTQIILVDRYMVVLEPFYLLFMVLGFWMIQRVLAKGALKLGIVKT